LTDLIHEPPRTEAAAPRPPADPAENARDGQKRVFTYIAVLFTAAFILILWTFLMSHRSNQQVISELKDSKSVLQTTLAENGGLSARVRELEAQLSSLQSQNAQLTTDLGGALDRQAALEQEAEALRRALAETQAQLAALEADVAAEGDADSAAP